MAARKSPRHRNQPLSFVAPMEARLVDELPEGREWQYEPKWDGFRCIALRDARGVRLFAKSGKPLDRYFPEVVAMIEGLPGRRFMLDGELVIVQRGAIAFDALQMRLHPAASRVRRLAAETPATYVMFDLLATADRNLLDQPLRERRSALESFVGEACGRSALRALTPAALRRTKAGAASLRLSAATTRLAQARRWLAGARGSIDGLVAKRLDRPYVPGEREMQKFKPQRTADCVVGGFRYASGSRLVGSLLLGLYDDEGKLNHVGFTASIPLADRPALTRRLLALRKPPGFTGAAPGGPSRWSTERSAQWEPLDPKLVVEVGFDHVTGCRFRHGTRLLRWRPDKAPRQCRFDQIGC